MTGTLVLAAFSAELCVAAATDSWDLLEAGDALLISGLLGDVMGNPTIHSANYGEAGIAQMLLADVDIAGRTGQWMRVTINAQEDTFSVEFAPLVADEEMGTETAGLDGFGQINLSVDSSCTAERSMVGGNALWIDEENRRHEVKMPADQELGSDMVFGDDVPWIPVSGGISWEARIDKQRRTITTKDADEIRVNESLERRWPVVVQGPDWSGNALTTIAP
jgi:hypothetical protein